MRVFIIIAYPSQPWQQKPAQKNTIFLHFLIFAIFFKNPLQKQKTYAII
jgi:hypothetical protein